MGIQKQNIKALDDWKEKKREHEKKWAGIGRAPVDKSLSRPQTYWKKPHERESPVPARRERRPPQIRRASTLAVSTNPGMSVTSKPYERKKPAPARRGRLPQIRRVSTLAEPTNSGMSVTSMHNRRGRETLLSVGQTIICDICHARGGEEARTCGERPRDSQGYSCVNCYKSSHRKCRWYGEVRYEHGLSAFYEGRDRPPPQLRRTTAKTTVFQEHEGSRQAITARRNASANNPVDVEREKLKKLASTMGQLLSSAQLLLDGINHNMKEW